ncbi:ESCO1/2 family N-acetyltransferase [Streptomyces sp. A3M-1-3]|uniref:ESCO1/2 family N-acetyltransferase n=1 Tax=Streptomyces sp. A3M-1-3 TaxID=2962044 RepID=UPI0020B819AD|nr:ESCO1/2 family N-acetyltransferase [Streptomyces sp. A3M-1-3]MCP3820320.1 ESCO1/2 family N-acetyltransferase [Streptomyces sp. A3M-1-3]
MAERTTHLNPDPRTRDSRKIHVRAARWYASVELDRDAYVDTASSLGHDPELPAAFIEAVDRARDASVDRIWYDGYPGSFACGGGSRWVTLFVQFPYVEAAVEALRAAELDRDYSRLHTLADRLALPVDDWLAPGERELIRGVDFDPPPSAFLKFLRGKAKECGVSLNGRATAGGVWVRPTLPPAQKQNREMFPEQYPGWVDRWTGYVDSDDAPIRPWVGGSDQDLSYGSIPVQFLAAQTQLGGNCPCGMSLRESGNGDRAHTAHHAAWALGTRVPKNLEWLSDLAVVTTQSPIAWRRLTYKVARMPQRENHYDFPSWSHLGEPEVTPDNVRAYLLKANGYVIGYLTAHDPNEHRRWDLIDGSPYGDEDGTLRPSIDLIWVADAYRRQGVGATLVRALAADFGCEVADVSWSSPISDAGRRLARRLSPEGIWIN